MACSRIARIGIHQAVVINRLDTIVKNVNIKRKGMIVNHTIMAKCVDLGSLMKDMLFVKGVTSIAVISSVEIADVPMSSVALMAT